MGIIGTGATAIQCVPHLARSVKQLLVFQRTPSTVDVRGNRPTDPAGRQSLDDGWQRRRIENFQLLTAGGDADEDLVDDAWTSIVKKLFVMRQNSIEGMSDEERLRTVDMADFAKMEEIRARVDSIVADPATAEALKPWYGYFCKRPCFHDEYLQTFNRDNVTLVDTQGKGVERITTDGVVVDGTEHSVDCLIFATGFEVGTEYARRTGFEIVGRDGLTLTDKWRDGVRTFHGLTVNGFPNCFVLSIAQSGFTVNFPYLLDVQARHTAEVITWGLKHDAMEMEASAQAESAWVDTVVARTGASAQRAKSCTPGYYNREGQANAKTRQGSFFYRHPNRIRRHSRDIEDTRRAGGVRDSKPAVHPTIRPDDQNPPIPGRPDAGVGPTPFASSGDHRGRLRRTGRRGRVAAQRHRRPVDHRAFRWCRRHLAAEHLSRCGVRHSESPVFVLVRAEPEVEPAPTPTSRRSSPTSSRSPTISTCAAT